MLFDGANILITGGTGSLGSFLLRRLLTGEQGIPDRIIILSRDEAKQSSLKSIYALGDASLREVFNKHVEFHIGDIRDYSSVAEALDGIDIVFNAAALKQVPACEFYPFEAVRTNIEGPENIIRAIQQRKLNIKTVIGISTDKAVKPVNVMGMTKAIQERLFLSGYQRCPDTRFVCARYGNVLASRGSVIPLFQDQIKNGGPITITDPTMTRFLLSLDGAVDAVFVAVEHGVSGEIFVPDMLSARVTDIAKIMIGDKPIKIEITGIRPGEKIHEILISEEEIPRTYKYNNYFVVSSALGEFKGTPCLKREFNSADVALSFEEVKNLLATNGLL